METKNHTDKKQLNKIISIINDDVKIIDFLADLKDREPIHGLERFIKWGDHESALLLYDCVPDNLVVLILYKSQFGFNEKENKLMLYAHNNLRDMIKYFKSWWEATAEGNERIHSTLNDITMLLFHEWVEAEENSVQSNFIG
jgi:hypothetical protein